MKGRNVTVKKNNNKAFSCTIVKRSGFCYYRRLMVSSLVSMTIAILQPYGSSLKIYILIRILLFFNET